MIRLPLISSKWVVEMMTKTESMCLWKTTNRPFVMDIYAISVLNKIDLFPLNRN